jgi:hypothetical protein
VAFGSVKMYEGISTGKNLNYGKKGEKKYIANSLLVYCKKQKILENIKYAGSGRLVIRDLETGVELKSIK